MKRLIAAPGAAPTIFPSLELSSFLDYIKAVWDEGRTLQPKWWNAKREVDIVGGFFTMLNNDERRMRSGIGFGHFVYESQNVQIDPATNMPKIVGRTDIQFLHGSTMGPHITMEFKRLDNKTKLRREYFISGVARFVSGQYAENHDTGYMVGVVEGDITAEKTGMIKYIRRSTAMSTLKLIPITHPQYGDPSQDNPTAQFDTKHGRNPRCSCKEIRVGHILLER